MSNRFLIGVDSVVRGFPYRFLLIIHNHVLLDRLAHFAGDSPGPLDYLQLDDWVRLD